MNGSWKTSVSGIIAALMVIGQAVQDHLDTGSADWGLAVAAVVGCIGLLMARDKNVSSEVQGIRRNGKKILPLLACIMIIGGCSTASSTPDLLNEAREENSGWSDADNRNIRVIIEAGVSSNSYHPSPPLVSSSQITSSATTSSKSPAVPVIVPVTPESEVVNVSAESDRPKTSLPSLESEGVARPDKAIVLA